MPARRRAIFMFDARARTSSSEHLKPTDAARPSQQRIEMELCSCSFCIVQGGSCSLPHSELDPQRSVVSWPQLEQFQHVFGACDGNAGASELEHPPPRHGLLATSASLFPLVLHKRRLGTLLALQQSSRCGSFVSQPVGPQQQRDFWAGRVPGVSSLFNDSDNQVRRSPPQSSRAIIQNRTLFDGSAHRS